MSWNRVVIREREAFPYDPRKPLKKEKPKHNDILVSTDVYYSFLVIYKIDRIVQVDLLHLVFELFFDLDLSNGSFSEDSKNDRHL